MAGAVVVAVGVVGAVSVIDRDSKKPTHTSTEAACIMLGKGDSPSEARRAMELLVSDGEARRAVDAAVANGC